METVQHPATDLFLGAPSDMQDGSCETLPVVTARTEHGTFACSFWKPAPEELAALNAGSCIQLGVRVDGRPHPVITMAVTKDPV